MSDRRYSDEDARRILALATEVDAATPAAAADGYTLAELQRAAAEAGLSPASVAAAAMTLERASAGDARYLGLPVSVSRAVPLARAMSDDDWHRLVGQLRDTFNARGREEVRGAHREWRVGNLRIVHEPTAHGALLDLRTVKGDARALPLVGVTMLAAAGTVTVAAALTGTVGPRLLSLALLGVMGLGVTIGSLVRLPFWARTRAKQFESLGAFARRLVGAGDPTLARVAESAGQ